MRVKEYLKNLWNDLRHDQGGQWGSALKQVGFFPAIQKGKEVVKQKALEGARRIAKKIYQPPYQAWQQAKPYIYGTPKSYGGSVSPTYGYPRKTSYRESMPPTYGYPKIGTPPKPEKEQVIGSAGVGGAGVGGAGVGGAGVGGVTYQVPKVSGFPTYQIPQVNLNIPNFGYAPTPEQTAAMQETARTRAGLVIDPQRQAEMEALESYKSEVTGQMGEINPRMTEMSLALANMVQNTMKQDIIDELIRRGATTSGELPRQLGEAGRYEVEQRRGVEEERNRLIGALQKQQLGREELSGTRLAELERMRGMQEASELGEQERYARERSMAEKSALFEAQLAKAQLQYGAATTQYESAYQQRLFEAEMAQQTWERGISEQELELQRATAAYGREPDPLEELKKRQYEIDIETMEYDLEQARKAAAQIYGFGTYGSAGFKAGQVSGMRAY